jgi:hypothetical protein
VVQARLDTTANSFQPGVDKSGMAERENLADGTDGKDLSTVGYSARWCMGQLEDGILVLGARIAAGTLPKATLASQNADSRAAGHVITCFGGCN